MIVLVFLLCFFYGVQLLSFFPAPKMDTIHPIGSLGLVYLPTFTIYYHLKTTIHVGKYTSPMDPLGMTTQRTHTTRSNWRNFIASKPKSWMARCGEVFPRLREDWSWGFCFIHVILWIILSRQYKDSYWHTQSCGWLFLPAWFLVVVLFFFVHPEPWGNHRPIWRADVSNGLVQPPTRKVVGSWRIIPWLGSVVNHVGPHPNGLFMACKWGVAVASQVAAFAEGLSENFFIGDCDLESSTLT